MKLEDIGFYTLSDDRAFNVSLSSDLIRCELILTSACNFSCKYCRGIRKDYNKTLSLDEAKHVIDLWAKDNIRNVRFSGGEPTIWPGLIDLVKYTKLVPSIQHIALSTNGSADIKFYLELVEAGANDFSISLDACCSATANTMGGKDVQFQHISEVIKTLSKLTYVTVGIVLEEENIAELDNTIKYAHDLGVADIRIIPSAQYNATLTPTIGEEVMDAHPILKYRMNNIKNNRHVRGLKKEDTGHCYLVLDDMIVTGDNHFPCVIYMREQGNPIGTIKGKTIRQIREERLDWLINNDTHKDAICKKNCLDVCIDHNNQVHKF